jgi:hypothetical protein
VADLVKGGFITVLTTDLTKLEVAKKLAKNDFDVIKEIGRPHFRKITKDVTGVELPAVTKAEIFDRLFKKSADETEKMFAALERFPPDLTRWDSQEAKLRMGESLCIDSPSRGLAMPKAYSGDLRERVIEAVEIGASRREAAERFEVSVSSAVKWLQRWRESRNAAPKPRGEAFLRWKSSPARSWLWLPNSRT